MPAALYEHPAWLHVPGQIMRPGGLSITEQMLAFCDLQPGAYILDVGCGAGATLHYIDTRFDCHTFGIDVSKNLLFSASHDHSRISFSNAHSEHLPFRSESMDVVLSECTLSLFKIDSALREFARVLKQNGYLIVSDLYARNADGLPALHQLPPDTCIHSAMSREQIEQALHGSGYEIEVWKDCSDQLKSHLACTFAEAAEVDIFDLYIAAAKAKLGYYFLVARKVCYGRA